MGSRFCPRFLVALMVALASCTPDPTIDTTDPLDGKTPMEVCLERCAICKPASYDCEKDCVAALRDATPVCERLVAVQFACERDFILQKGCDAPLPCAPEWGDATDCLWKNGCLGSSTCEPDGDICYCSRSCKPNDPPLQYRVECTPGATATEIHCDCMYDGALVGSCQQTELVCDVWTSCCNQYFPALQVTAMP